MVRPLRRLPGQSRAAKPPLISLRYGGWRDSIDFLALVALLMLCALGGGSAFADTLSLLYVRPAAVLALVLFLLTPAPADWRSVRPPLLMLAALAFLMVCQLVPLPPKIWLALPGRAPYAEAAPLAGINQPWRPLSLTPDLTLNSLVSLVIPAAVLAGFAKIGSEQRRWLCPGLVVLCGASAALGILQFAGGTESVLYLYKRTYPGFPVGVLANRNHQAALLAMIFPALRVWTLGEAGWHRMRRRQGLALAAGAVTIPVLLATGSRAGILLGAISIAVALLAFPGVRPAGAPAPRLARWLRLGVPALLLLMVLLSYWLGRAASIERFSQLSVEDDQRFQFAPLVIALVKTSFPVGTGFGSFDPVFRQYEPDAVLINTYFNHAHNELLELAMTAGLPGLLLLAVLLAWVAARTVAVARTEGGTGEAGPRLLALLGASMIAILLAASTVDYPLRTPLMAALFALACGWLCAPDRHLSRASL